MAKKAMMASPQTENQSGSPESEKPFDELISELMTKRKIQQDALLKIKASVAKRQVPDGREDRTDKNPKRNRNPKQ